MPGNKKNALHRMAGGEFMRLDADGGKGGVLGTMVEKEL